HRGMVSSLRANGERYGALHPTCIRRWGICPALRGKIGRTRTGSRSRETSVSRRTEVSRLRLRGVAADRSLTTSATRSGGGLAKRSSRLVRAGKVVRGRTGGTPVGRSAVPGHTHLPAHVL